MAGKKDFTAANTGRVYSAIAEATAAPEAPQAQDPVEAQEAQEAPKTRKKRRAYTPEEVQEALMTGKTGGKPGIKAARINIAFTPDLHAYVTTMSRVRGQTLSDFVEDLVRQSMKDNAELYAEAQTFLQRFK